MERWAGPGNKVGGAWEQGYFIPSLAEAMSQDKVTHSPSGQSTDLSEVYQAGGEGRG